MSKMQIPILLVLLLFSLPTFAFKVIHYDNWEDINSQLARIKPTTVVILNIEDVIVQPVDQILQSRHRAFKQKLVRHLEGSLHENEAEDVLSLQIHAEHLELVDTKVLEVLDSLKRNNVKVIVMSNSWTGGYGLIPSLEDLRLNKLKALGIDFTWSLGYTSIPIIFDNYKTTNPKRLPRYTHGVLFTCHMAKGEVLESLFTRMKWIPQEILYIDSLRKHIDSVGSFCQKHSISFTAILYDAALQKDSSELNHNRADLQFSVLRTQKKWLSDSEANALLNSKQ